MCLEMELVTDDGNGWVYQAGLIRAVADHHDIPVVLHLDHTNSLDNIRRAVDHGFTSVMIDGSQLPFAENAELSFYYEAPEIDIGLDITARVFADNVKANIGPAETGDAAPVFLIDHKLAAGAYDGFDIFPGGSIPADRNIFMVGDSQSHISSEVCLVLFKILF